MATTKNGAAPECADRVRGRVWGVAAAVGASDLGIEGRTPVLKHRFNWKRLSLAGALAYEPDGTDAHLVFQLRPGAYNDETLIELLFELVELGQQRPVVLIWDGLPSHHSRRMRTWLAGKRHWLRVEPLPGYAHDLNPIEQVWGNLKSNELRTLCADTIHEIAEIAEGRKILNA